MIVLPYNRPKHREQLITLLKNRCLDPILADQLPQFGLVALRYGQVVGCGFGRWIEGGCIMLDSFMTNPESPPGDRHRALDLITLKLLKIAKQYNKTKLICMTTDESIAKRAERHGFHRAKHLVLVKNGENHEH